MKNKMLFFSIFILIVAALIADYLHDGCVADLSLSGAPVCGSDALFTVGFAIVLLTFAGLVVYIGWKREKGA